MFCGLASQRLQGIVVMWPTGELLIPRKVHHSPNVVPFNIGDPVVIIVHCIINCVLWSKAMGNIYIWFFFSRKIL